MRSVVGLLLSCVLVVRAARFLRHPDVPSARGERDYYDWAWRSPLFVARLEQARLELLDGELVAISVPPGTLEPWWVRYVADYALPAQGLVAVDAGDGRSPALHVTRLVFDTENRLEIHRMRRAGHP